MQNPITMLIGKLDAGFDSVEKRIQSLAGIIMPLNPVVIYLDNPTHGITDAYTSGAPGAVA